MITSPDKLIIEVYHDDKAASYGFAKIIDPKLPGISIRLDNLSKQNPEIIFNTLAKACGKRVAREFFKKAYEKRIWFEDNFVEELIAQ